MCKSADVFIQFHLSFHFIKLIKLTFALQKRLYPIIYLLIIKRIEDLSKVNIRRGLPDILE